ncbi:hypothetical protein [Solibacillus sp. FSL K6-4121]|uniref:hypothetical protein n=1 Tax=Solibacillus sp. FSL K6-4121 TaxID=2921505 RepID=UPI0030FBEC01
MKYFIRFLVALAICGAVWIVHPAREQVRELEKDISYQYLSANRLLGNTVEELLEWDFSQPLTNGDREYIQGLYLEMMYLTSLLFNGNVVHFEWEQRMYDIQSHIHLYMLDSSLSEEDVADLEQALQATRFITKDFQDVRFPDYGAMHDEKHKMVEKIKKRLETQY